MDTSEKPSSVPEFEQSHILCDDVGMHPLGDVIIQTAVPTGIAGDLRD